MENLRYYIQPGEKIMMFTLRVRWDEPASYMGEPIVITRDQYIRNLSIDKDRAVEKAKAFIEDPNLLLSDAANLQDLNEIRRREAEEVRLERERREAEYEEQRISRQNRLVDMIVSGIMPFGMYSGDKIASLPRSYALFWLNMDNDDSDVVLDALQKALTFEFPMLANLPKPNGEYIGVPKQRLTFTATVVESFGFDGFYGWTNVKKYVTDTGESLTYMGSGQSPGDLGDTVTFKGTIKKHEVYRDEASTYILRPSEVKAK